MNNEIKVIKIRSSFFEIITFLEKYKIDYWIGRGLLEKIYSRLIVDDPVKHDIDFHILIKDRERLLQRLIQNKYDIKQNNDYKIQILGKSDNRRIEFVFLVPDGKYYKYKRKNNIFLCPQHLFGADIVQIIDKKVKVPTPINDYFNCIEQEY